MKLFKASQPVQSVEDQAAAVRLMAIASRSKPRIPDCAPDQSPEPPEASENLR